MYNDILVHIDGGRRCQVRLDLALGLARRFDARLIGVFAQLDHDAPSIVAGRAGERLLAAAETAKAAFLAAAEAAAVRHEWLPLPHGEPNLLIRELVICGRYADLVVLGQYDAQHDRDRLPPELNEEMILQSGSPILLVPHSGRFPTLGDHVMVAWNGSRECARAVHDALPLIRDAGTVRVLGLHAHHDPAAATPKLNIVSRLAGLGIEPRYDVLAPQDIGVMDMILSRCADVEADLLVMGAHGHYGFPFLHRGAGTKHILRHMTVPVLMAH